MESYEVEIDGKTYQGIDKINYLLQIVNANVNPLMHLIVCVFLSQTYSESERTLYWSVSDTWW